MMIKILMTLTLALVSFQTVVSQEKNGDSILKKTGKPLPSVYRPVFPELTKPEHKVKDADSIFETLANQQQNTLESVGCLKTRAWFWLTNESSVKPGLILAEHFSEADPYRHKVLHWYPKKGIEQKNIQPQHENFDLINARIRTPEMFVSYKGFERKGIDSVSIKNAEARHSDLDLSQLLFRYHKPPHEFFERLRTIDQHQFEVRKNGALVEIAFWPSASTRERSRKWIFNIEHGGLLVRHEDRLVSTIVTLVDVKHVEKEGRWLPREMVIERVNMKAEKLEYRHEYDFFELDRIAPEAADPDGFLFRSIPVKNENVRVNDGRTGRIQNYPHKDFREKKKQK